MTLLFATFVVLYGIKPEGETTVDLGLVSSVRESFIEVPDDIDPKAKRGPINKDKFVFKFWKEKQKNPKKIKIHKRYEELQNIINGDYKKIKDVAELVEKKLRRFKYMDKDHILKVRRSESDISIILAASYFYYPGKYRLNYKHISKIEPLAILLKSLKKKILVEGHTDSIIPKNMSNWELSALRASYFMHYLIDDHDFPADFVDSSGFADQRNLFTNETREGRMGNRRIEIRIRYE